MEMGGWKRHVLKRQLAAATYPLTDLGNQLVLFQDVALDLIPTSRGAGGTTSYGARGTDLGAGGHGHGRGGEGERGRCRGQAAARRGG